MALLAAGTPCPPEFTIKMLIEVMPDAEKNLPANRMVVFVATSVPLPTLPINDGLLLPPPGLGIAFVKLIAN